MMKRAAVRPSLAQVQSPNRREVLRYGFAGLGLMMTSSWFAGCGESSLGGQSSNIENIGAVTWLAVPDPSGATMSTRTQVPQSTAFRGGEGIWYQSGMVYFTTKGDNRVWGYDTAAATIDIVYDDDFFVPAELTGVDNIVGTAGGDLLVAEDGGNMQIVAHTPAGSLVPVIQIVGHDLSEITGPAFDPSGTRLYFSSQRGATGNPLTGGVTYEVSGPFVL